MNAIERYALVRAGKVENVVLWDGVSGETWQGPRLADLPPEQPGGEPTPQYMPQPEGWLPWSQSHGEGVAVVKVTDTTAPVGPDWTYENGAFVAPPAPPVPPVTAEQAKAQRDAMLAEATVRIAPLQDAADLGIATPAEGEALQAWKEHRVALSRIELQPGFPAAVEWPAAPE